jgi:uncharacterized membrane protein YecN with MAPEG domain
MPIVTALYAGLLGLISMGVAFPAGSLRGKLNISVGDGGNRDLLLAMRRHANFTIAGIRADTVKSLGRFLGAMATAAVTVISSVWLIILFAHR